jgi:hypothetical protein
VKTCVRNCTNVIIPRKKKLLTHTNRRAPKLVARIKLQNYNMAIRFVIYNVTAPTYKLAKFALETLKNFLDLKF